MTKYKTTLFLHQPSNPDGVIITELDFDYGGSAIASVGWKTQSNLLQVNYSRLDVGKLCFIDYFPNKEFAPILVSIMVMIRNKLW